MKKKGENLYINFSSYFIILKRRFYLMLYYDLICKEVINLLMLYQSYYIFLKYFRAVNAETKKLWIFEIFHFFFKIEHLYHDDHKFHIIILKTWENIVLKYALCKIYSMCKIQYRIEFVYHPFQSCGLH